MTNDKIGINLTRRDFIKASGVFLISFLGCNTLVDQLKLPVGFEKKQFNVIIFLFDALSARNMSLYGYPRQTTPNLEKFARNSVVYHAHHSCANYTTPSTASLLTGTYPWTNGAFHGLPLKNTVNQNLFHEIRGYYRVGYSQNLLADLILYQYDDSLDQHLKIDEFSLNSSIVYKIINQLFSNDGLSATLASQGFLYSTKNRAGSLFFSLADKIGVELLHTYYRRKYKDEYPDNLPYSYLNNMIFDQEELFDGIQVLLKDLPFPSQVYLHFWSPHDPYRPHKEFIGLFDENPWQPINKSDHPLVQNTKNYEILNILRTRYDEVIAHMDAEFGRLIKEMENSGLLENSYVIVTSDHGEMFERGVDGHVTPLLYESLLHIPLIIHQPGQQSRMDIRSITSNIDLLPTLLHLNGQSIPGWCEGEILPGLGGEVNPNRSIFAIEAHNNSKNRPLTECTIAMIKSRYKLIYYNYPGYENIYELYDLIDDPEELDDLIKKKDPIIDELKVELLTNLKQANRGLGEK